MWKGDYALVMQGTVFLWTSRKSHDRYDLYTNLQRLFFRVGLGCPLAIDLSAEAVLINSRSQKINARDRAHE